MVLDRRPASKYAFAAVLAVSIAVAQGQTPPNLSGTWKCNIEKSNWGNSTPPPDLTIKINHKNPEMLITQIVAGQSDELRFITDGRENVNDISEGKLTSKLTWDRNVLVVETRLGDGEVTLSDRLTLSPDGNTIRMTRKMKGPDGEADRELILEKQGAAKRNLSGTWKVIIARSDFGAVPAPASMISKIDHQDPAVKISTVTMGDQGERSYVLTFTTDGAETSNTAGNMVFKTRCRWEDGALLMESKAGDGDLIGKDKWTLSEDGKTLTLLRVWSRSEGEMTQKLVHEKQ